MKIEEKSVKEQVFGLWWRELGGDKANLVAEGLIGEE